MNETFLFFGVMSILFVLVIAFGIMKMFKTNSLRQSFLQSTLIGLLLYAIVSIWWFFIYATDGFSQIFGVLYYGIAFIISCLVNYIVLYLITKLKSK
ncbi:hypothetical protein ACJ2A9_16925 [Anaerobacillus sp. MEB173]|uniref:hypothetical protein n=1 Tax=Anaerobacillus sp. MEB173 TaxID=3383345 RepID=UPI003F8F8934